MRHDDTFGPRPGPSGWGQTSVGELCSVLNGLAFKPEDWGRHGLPIIRIQNLNGSDEFNFYDGWVPERYIIPSGTLLFSWSGNRGTSFGPYIWGRSHGILNQHIFRVAPKANVDRRWLFYALDEVRKQVERAAHGGSGLVHIRRGDFLAYEVPTPPGREQRRIAGILHTLDESIRRAKELILKMKQVKQGLLQDLLTRGIDANGELRNPERIPDQFKVSALGRIPVRWEVLPIERLLANVDPAMRSGPFGSALLKSELVEAGVPLLGIDNVHVERFVDVYTRFVTPAKAAELARYRVRPHDVMITIMGTVGRSCVVPAHVGHALSSKHVWTLSLDRDRYSPLLACLQINHSPWALRHLRRDEQGGVMSAIRSETLRSLLLPVPPPAEMREIEQILATLSGRIEHEQQEAAKLRLLKQGLMDDLLTGRVRVTPLLAESTP